MLDSQELSRDEAHIRNNVPDKDHPFFKSEPSRGEHDSFFKAPAASAANMDSYQEEPDDWVYEEYDPVEQRWSSVNGRPQDQETLVQRIDRWLTHRYTQPLLLAGTLGLDC